MSGLLFRDPVRAIDGGDIKPGGVLSIFDEDGVTLSALYAEPANLTRLTNPLTADAAGYLPPIYLATDTTYRVRLVDADDVEVFDETGVTTYLLPLSVFDVQPHDPSGEPMPFATRTFWLAETTQLTEIYADAGLTTPLDNPVAADSAGLFPQVWLNVTRACRVKLEDGDGVLMYDVDQFVINVGSVPPVAPVLSGVLNGDADAINLSWTAATSQFSTIEGYRLYDADTDALIVDQVPRTYEFSPVSEGNSYSFYVIGYDANGIDSERSNIVTISINVLSEIITSSRTWVKPVGLLSLTYELLAGGAGGGSGNHVFGDVTGGMGGGGAEYRSGSILAAALASTESVVIGAGGTGGAPVTGGAAVGNVGQDGGDSSFAGIVIAKGGKGGRAGGSGASTGGEGGTGGSGGTGEAGGAGGVGSVSSAPTAGGTTVRAGAGGGGAGGRSSGTPIAPGAVGGAVTNPSPDTAGGTAGTAGTSGGAHAGNGGGGANGASSTAGGGGGGGGGPGSGLSTGDRDGGNGGDGGLYGSGGGGSGGGYGSTIGPVDARSGQAGGGRSGVLKLVYTYVP